MRNRVLSTLALLCLFGTGVKGVAPTPAPEDNPEGTTGALKTQIQTGGSYDAHSGNATRSVTDLNVPGALGDYGLDFTRYWNSVHNDDDNAAADWPMDFGASGWSHSWKWTAAMGTDEYQEAEGGGEPGRIIYVTSITITFPDGHASKFSLFRSNVSFYGQNPYCVAPPYPWGEPYRPQCGETTEWSDPGVVHDHLRDMAVDGSQFWLVRADGGSVRFVAVGDQYQAKEVYDPHGFRTDLYYNALGDLDEVVQEGGRSLNIIWGSFGPSGALGRAITKVQTGDGSQYVNYKYQAKYQGDNGFMVLAKVIYPNDPAPGQSAEAFYSYEWPSYSRAPVLRYADDPRFSGPMRTIRYDYLSDGCEPSEKPDTDPASAAWNYFYARPEAIVAERSGDQLDQFSQPVLVSQFAIGCFTGTRAETNGLGAWRMFYFGRAAGLQEGHYNKGFELGRVTDFTTQNPIPASVPRRRQRGGNQPSTTWDGCNNRTDFLAWNSGHLADVRYADLNHCTYDWVNPGQSEAPDTSRIHDSPYHHWLFQKKDERNQPTTYVRDLRRRIKRIEYPDGSQEHFEYDNNVSNGLNQVTKHTLASGAIETYVYDASTHLLTQESNSIDGPNERKEYTYYGPGNHPEWTGLVETMTDARARISSAPFTVRMTYNGRHQVTSVEYPPTPGGGSNPTVHYEYDKYGNCIAITNELGHRSTYTYDSYRRCTSYTEPLNAPAWDGNSTVPSRTWNWVYDRVIEGGGQFGPYAHTSREWRVQVEPVSFYPDCRRRVTARTFDVNNRIVSEQTGLTQPCNPQPGGWVPGDDTEIHRFNYDENGQKSRFIDPRGRVTDYVYNNRNLLWKTIEYPMPGSTGTVRTTQTFYNATGDKIQVIFPDGKTQRWPNENYDAFGQPGKFYNENNNLTDLIYCWGPMKKLYKVIAHRDGEEQLTEFGYDLMGRPTKTLFPDGSYEETIYKYGQVESWKNRRGKKKVIDQYDARGRENHHYWLEDDGVTPDSSTPATTRGWDAANRLISIANVWSAIEYGYDDAGQAKWERSNVVGADGGPAQVTYYRFPSGEVSRTIYPNWTSVQRFYTARGQLKDVGWGAGATSYVYHPDGKVSSQFRTNGVTTSYGYDGRGMIGLLEHKNASDQSLAYREYWRDERDRITAWKRGIGGLNGMEDGRGDRYKYDAEGQLERAWYRALSPWTEEPQDPKRGDHFEYDALGNRRDWNDVANRGAMLFQRKNNGLNQYYKWENSYPNPPQHWGTTTNYDADLGGYWGVPGQANGVLMQDGHITASFNALNQPTGIWSKGYPGGEFTAQWMWFGYDPLGRCVKRWKSTAAAWLREYNPATYYYYDGWNLVQEGSSATMAERVYVHGGRVDEIVASWAGSQWYNHHYDARGHCILLTSANGTLLEQYDYDAFGFPYFYTATGGPGLVNGKAGSPAGNRFLFTGREWLKDHRLYDYRNRMYQPELGRFLQPDPKQFEAGDYNLYRYCHNDPVNKSDPLGLYDVGFEGYGAPGLTGGTKDTVGNVALRTFIGSKGMFSRTQTGQELALSAIRNALATNPSEPIRIFGYSRGAKAANDVARKAGAEGIRIQHLVLIDPVSILARAQSLQIPSNVERADNYYQKSGGPFRGGPAANPSSSVVNTDVSGPGIDHNTIVARVIELQYVPRTGSHIPEATLRYR